MKYENFHIKCHILENTEICCLIPLPQFLTFLLKKIGSAGTSSVSSFILHNNQLRRKVCQTHIVACLSEVVSDHEKKLRIASLGRIHKNIFSSNANSAGFGACSKSILFLLFAAMLLPYMEE